GPAEAEPAAPCAQHLRLHLRRLPDRELSTTSRDQSARSCLMPKKPKIDMSSQPQPEKGGPPIVTSVLVEVRNSPVHGRGVFAVAPISKGTRIIEYLGDRVSHEAADKRYEDHDESDNHTFLFIVDKKTALDARVRCNDARFINHQCAGNYESVIENRRVFIDAVRDIEP